MLKVEKEKRHLHGELDEPKMIFSIVLNANPLTNTQKRNDYKLNVVETLYSLFWVGMDLLSKSVYPPSYGCILSLAGPICGDGRTKGSQIGVRFCLDFCLQTRQIEKSCEFNSA